MIRFQIKISNHGFRVKVFYSNDKSIINDFYEGMAEWEEGVNHFGEKVKTIKCVYATYKPHSNTYGFHISLLEDFKEKLADKGVKDSQIETLQMGSWRAAGISLELADGVEPDPKRGQDKVLDFLDVLDSVYSIPLQTGGGKAQPLDAKILTPEGWSTMGDMHVGKIITGRNGQPIEVTKVHPQGVTSVSKITFSDGRSTRCCPDHLWQVYHNDSNEPSVMSTSTIYGLTSGSVTTTSENFFYIDLMEPEDVKDLEYTRSPRLLGKLIGEGWVPPFIPDRYLEGSIKQRYELLSGLFYETSVDSDGEMFQALFINLKVAKLAIQIARSLGGIAKVTRASVGSKYICYMTLPKSSTMLGITDLDVDMTKHRLCISKIEHEAPCETQCISVSAEDRLYITDDYIVTHNTFCTLYHIWRYGKRAACIMGASHMETWAKDAGWIFKENPNAIRKVNGREEMKQLIQDAKDGTLKADILLFSTNTISDYIKDYEMNFDCSYGVDPDEFYELLKVGIRVTDEAHEKLHFGFRHDIEMNCPVAIYLSATIVSDDTFKNNLYKRLFPLKRRFEGIAWRKYIHATALGYYLEEPEKARYNGFRRMYNHMVFEKWISERKDRKAKYFDLICKATQRGFVDVRKEGEKCLIFLASVEMCAELSDYLKKNLSNKDLTISDYTSKHDSKVLHCHDIVCTTIGSAGTGKDIKGLRTTLLTVGVANKEKRIQILGRLRELDDVEPDFYYLTCLDIPKHNKYHEANQKLFKPLCASVRAVNTGMRI